MNKTQCWNKIRKQLLYDLAVHHGNWGYCEMDGCTSTFGLALAHRVKRRKMPSFKKEREAHEQELRVAAYLCGKCHRELEYSDPQVMFDKITDIVENRE